MLNTFQIVSSHIVFCLTLLLIALIIIYPIVYILKRMFMVPIHIMSVPDADLLAAKEFARQYVEYRRLQTEERVFNKKQAGIAKEVRGTWIL